MSINWLREIRMSADNIYRTGDDVENRIGCVTKKKKINEVHDYSVDNVFHITIWDINFNEDSYC